MTSHHVYGSPNRAERRRFISLMPRPSLAVAPLRPTTSPQWWYPPRPHVIELIGTWTRPGRGRSGERRRSGRIGCTGATGGAVSRNACNAA